MSILLTLLKFLPEIIAIVKTIIKMSAEGKSELEIRAALKLIDSALITAVLKKDTSELEDIFRGKKK